ncbi:flagellar hook assembly protein FlgD [Craurococcus roseus]|uniref:Basal-body rod modification protein FlgD n=1 Tax=Craurococcus roseus TaxID=77585 RepID=A0ABP3QFY8_9PROT
MTNAVQAASAAPPAATAQKGRAAGFGSDFNSFLTLLTTQLKNQDPTKAMDAQQMTEQLVQFAQVEQAISMNGNMSKLIGLQQAAQLTAAAPLMGKAVEVSSDKLSLQDGRATLRLPAAGAAKEAQIAVLDANGKAVKTDTVALGAGAAEWAWDGRDSSGKRLPDGAYSFVVSGRDAGGGAAAVEATVRARATAAERADGGDLKLRLGGLSVGFDAVRGVDGG